MEHNLDNSLNLEGAIGGMDFEHSEDAGGSQSDMTLEQSVHESGIQMDFEQIQEKSIPMLMDTGTEEVIVSELMGDQFALQEYSIGDDQTTEITTTEESNIQNILQSQSDPLIDLQFEPHTAVTTLNAQEVQTQQKYIAVKMAVPNAGSGKSSEQGVSGIMPRQVAIAPKPPTLVQTTPKLRPASTSYLSPPGKQYAIAPRPVALVANKTNLTKKLTLAGKGNTVLAQIGKQFIMVPATSAHQKIKVVSAADSSVQCVRKDTLASLAGKNITGPTGKTMQVTKVVMQGNDPVVITKMLPTTSSGSPRARYVMQQKTIPISVGNNKVLLTSPNKQGKKQQIITIKSAPTTTASQQQASTTKKVVISANPTQKVILKATPTPKTAQLTKDGKIVYGIGQNSQLHKIDVPGKGIQLIRLITNSTSGPSKTTDKPTTSVPQKTFILTSGGKGLQMSADKIGKGQPPPLVITGSNATLAKSTVVRPQQKLVRIAPAPVALNAAQTNRQPRSGQSLLTPQPVAESSMSFDDLTSLLQPRITRKMESENEEVVEEEYEDQEYESQESEEVELQESKPSLHDLIADAADKGLEMQQVEVEFERQQRSPIMDESTNSMNQHDSSTRSDEHPLIVIPSNYSKQDNVNDDDSFQEEHSRLSNNMLRLDPEEMNSFQQSSTSPILFDIETSSTDLNSRPRKACNCTRSQCLKLYCDCFANGEFCNNCNCANCHNNLENEKLRQKAIRTCLDRNPNAFRPKIGKSKASGPEMIRRHNKGCNCKRSGCLKNYCECYEATIPCTALCKCVGCRNVEESVGRARRRHGLAAPRPVPCGPPLPALKQPCSFMTGEVIEAVCQCLLAAAQRQEPDALAIVIDEFARCLQDIISASHQTAPAIVDESQA